MCGFSRRFDSSYVSAYTQALSGSIGRPTILRSQTCDSTFHAVQLAPSTNLGARIRPLRLLRRIRPILWRHLCRLQHPRHRPRTLVLQRREQGQGPAQGQERSRIRCHGARARSSQVRRRRQRRWRRGVLRRPNRILLQLAHEPTRPARHD
jgi:hypothetical protein